MAVRVEKDVFWLQVAIHDVLRMEVLQSERHLGAVEARTLKAELATSGQVVEEFAAIEEVEDHVKLLRRLEREAERDDKRVVNLLQDVAFGHCMFVLLPLDYVGLVQDLHCVNFAIVLVGGWVGRQEEKWSKVLD